MKVTIENGKNWPKADVVNWCDPYVVMTYNEGETTNPVFNENFEIKNPVGSIHVECYDWDRVSKDDYLGSFSFDIPSFQGASKQFTFIVNLDDDYLKKRKDNNEPTTVSISLTKLQSNFSVDEEQEIAKMLKEEELKKKTYLQEYIPYLQSLSSKSSFELLYSSDIFPIDANTIYKQVSHKTNLMFLVITKTGCSFGSYHEKELDCDVDGNSFISNDTNGFVFSVVGAVDEPTKFVIKKPQETSLCLFTGTNQIQETVFGVNGAYYIKKNRTLYELDGMNNYYETGTEDSVLLGVLYPKAVPLAKVLIFHLE
ncbi:C2 domain-containing protein [Entamoeba marina]